MNKDNPNRLINSTSPYLLQHAYNPVDWYPWGQEALQKAKSEDKPILVSIGYSSCHWCHVMERESFENDTIAALMNRHFVNIKIDREERPDLDQIYMDAVQAMGQNGGWPLNVFLTPDRKPFYGGTYFPPENWAQMLRALTKAFEEKRERIEKSAEDLTEALSVDELAKYGIQADESPFTTETFTSVYGNFSEFYDRKDGGLKKSPKFPMPSNWQFALRYADLTDSQKALEQVGLTLTRMATGGLYDQVGGGFARYSTDGEWFAPHFEKMLYDNGQLLTLYAAAFKITGDSLYKRVLYQTLEWLEREMTHPSGGFYSALDADSEGEEGKFYTWTWNELSSLPPSDLRFLKDFYHVTEEGNWENSRNILHLSEHPHVWAGRHAVDLKIMYEQWDRINRTLLDIRTQKSRPGLDDKVLASWNGLMITGLVKAYEATGDRAFLEPALKNAEFLLKEMVSGQTVSRSWKDGVVSGNGYLEDYAFLITAFADLYEATFNEKWIRMAAGLTEYTLARFQDDGEVLFYFTSDSAEKLIARKKEIFDNVIPSGNSQMGQNLHRLGIILDNSVYRERAERMMQLVQQTWQREPLYLTNWGILYADLMRPVAEIVIVGDGADLLRNELSCQYLPSAIFMGTNLESNLPLLTGKTALNNKTTVYVCYNKTCKLPVHSAEEALKQIK